MHLISSPTPFVARPGPVSIYPWRLEIVNAILLVSSDIPVDETESDCSYTLVPRNFASISCPSSFYYLHLGPLPGHIDEVLVPLTGFLWHRSKFPDPKRIIVAMTKCSVDLCKKDREELRKLGKKNGFKVDPVQPNVQPID